MIDIIGDLTEDEVQARLNIERIAREKVYVGNCRDYTSEVFNFVNSLPAPIVKQRLIKFYYDRVRMYEGIQRQLNDKHI